MNWIQRILGGSLPQATTEEAISRAREEGRREVAEAALEVIRQAQSQPWPQNMGATRQAYAVGSPWSYHVQQAPGLRPGTLAHHDLLRRVADVYDPARACIEHLKREVRKTKWSIAPKEEKDQSTSTQTAIKEAEEFFAIKGGCGGFGRSLHDFELSLLEDLLVLGAAAVYLDEGPSGQQALVVDSATIKTQLDQYGWPDAQSPYAQYVMGAKVRDFSGTELIYRGLGPCSWQPYYRAPLEYLQQVTVLALAADEWNRSWLVEGTTPSEMLTMPAEWTPHQIAEFKAFWDAMVKGAKNRREMKFAPSGSKMMELSRKDQEFSELEQQLIRRTCSIFGVSPTSIGYAGSTYKVSQDQASSQTSEVGVAPLVEWRTDVFNRLLEWIGFDFLHVVTVGGREEQAGERTDRLVKAVGGPIMTLNEARAQEGLDPIEGGNGVGSSQQAPPADEETQPGKDTKSDLSRWRKKALRLHRSGIAQQDFDSQWIPTQLRRSILAQLQAASTEDEINQAFEGEQS